MAKRRNDNAQMRREDYEASADTAGGNEVKHGMTKASDEELKRRRVVSVAGHKKWSARSSPGSTISSTSTSTNPFARVQIGTPASTSIAATAKSTISFDNATSSWFTTGVDEKKKKKTEVLDEIQDDIDNSNFKADPEALVDVMKKAVDKMNTADWPKRETIIKKDAASAKLEEAVIPSASTTAVPKEKKETPEPAKPPVSFLTTTTETQNTSESEEGTQIYAVNAKGYRDTIPSQGWKSFGTGTVKLLRSKTGKHQLTLKQTSSAKIVVNIQIYKGMKFTKQKNCIGMVALMDEEVGRESFMFKVDAKIVDVLFDHLNESAK